MGFIAEDVPELVATKDRRGLSSMDVVAVLTRAVQQQQAVIEELQEKQRKIDEQQKIITAHSEEIAELKRLLILSNAVSKAD